MTALTTLSLALSEDLIWRIRELSELVRACQETGEIRRSALSRASVPILYAHWEGYFVNAGNYYLQHLCEQRLLMSALRDEFWALSTRRRFKPQQLLGEDQFTRFLIEIRSETDKLFKKGRYEKINGKSNLRSDCLKSCCQTSGLGYDKYEPYIKFIDKELCDKRNFIAHGQSLRFSYDELTNTRDKVVELMRITQTEIENCATSQSYLKS